MKTNENILKLNSLFGTLLLSLVFSSGANAKTVTWTGASSNSWGNIANWNGATLPSTNDNVFISHSANQPILDIDATVASITINGNGLNDILTLDGIHNLTVAGDVIVKCSAGDKIYTSSSTITIANGGSLSGSGKIDLSGNGKLYISGNLMINSLKADASTGSMVIFNGISQMINNGNEYHFNNLDIHAGYTDLVHTNLKIDGDLMGGGTLGGEDNKIQLAGDMMLVSYKPGKSTFELASADMGSASVQHLNANTFYILENFDQKTVLTGVIRVTHQLDFEKGNVYLGNDNAYISRDAKLTRNNDPKASHTEPGSKGYFIANGNGSLHLFSPIGFTAKAKAPVLTQCTACEISSLYDK